MKRYKLMDVLLLWPLILTKERMQATRRWFVVGGIFMMIALIIAAQFILR